MTQSRQYQILAAILLLSLSLWAQQKPATDQAAAKAQNQDLAAAVALMRNQFNADIQLKVRDEVRQAQQDLRQQVKMELKQELRQELKMELKQELRQELKMEIKQELRQELR